MWAVVNVGFEGSVVNAGIEGSVVNSIKRSVVNLGPLPISARICERLRLHEREGRQLWEAHPSLLHMDLWRTIRSPIGLH